MTFNAFLVDIGFTITRSKTNNPFGENARHHILLVCRCGHQTPFFNSVQKHILQPDQDKIYTDDNGLSSLICEKCSRNYPETMALPVIEPNKGKLFQINYTIESVQIPNNTITHIIKKERVYAIYRSNFKLESVFDSIEFNEQTKKSLISIDNRKHLDANYFISAIKVDGLPSETKSIYQDLEISNLNLLNKFFGFLSNIEYSGLSKIFDFLKILDYLIIDIDKIKTIPTIQEIYDSHEVITEEKINSQTGEIETKMFRLVDSGFGDGEKEKVPFVPSVYLDSVKELARLFFSIMSFENITTVLITKGYIFYDKFLQSTFVCDADVYIQHQATNPNKILEISTNYMSCGVRRNISHSSDNDPSVLTGSYLKISDTLYDAIRIPSDMDKLLKIFQLKILKKVELELLFQKYSTYDVYTAIGYFTQIQSYQKTYLTFQMVEHSVKYKLWDGYVNNRFWEDFLDTINTINQIIESKEKVREYLITNWKKLSRDERASYHEYLALKEDVIYQAKTPNKLKKLHDDVSILHAVFQDAKKAALYTEAIQDWDKKLNQEINEVSFTVIPSAKEMFVEHTVMNHCIQTYVDKVISKIFIPVRVRDTVSNERATLGITLDKDGMSFNQLKGYDNSRATKFLIDTVLEFCKKNEIKLENSNLIFVDLQPDNSKILKMPDYLDDKEAARIRKQKLESRITKANSPLTDTTIKSIMEKFKNETSHK